MRKLLPWALVLILLASSVVAWLDCTPPSCPSGYSDNGTYCSGSKCYRECVGLTCDDNWTQIFDDMMGFNNGESWDEDYSASYTSSNTSLCYQFKFDNVGQTTHMTIDDLYDPDGSATNCDVEGVAGFWEAGKPPNPWYENLTDPPDWTTSGDQRYWPSTPTSNWFDHIFVAKRAHSEYDTDDPPTYENYMNSAYSIYCAPTDMGCQDIGTQLDVNCSTSCYGHSTLVYIHQGTFKDWNPANTWTGHNEDLWENSQCPDSSMGSNEWRHPHFRVFSTPTKPMSVPTSCNRTNEAPSAINVQILPTQPTTGDDLYCDYDFVDPENYTEKNSVFEWWKNGFNQNINSRVLAKGNISVGDSWYCKVIPTDGLLNGTQQTSGAVTILSTVSNVELKVEGQTAWQRNGYLSGEEEAGFSQQLQDAINSCTPDMYGNCNITITLSSDSTGTIDIDRLKVYYEDLPNNAPNITNFSPGLNPVINETDSITFSITAQDPDNDTLYFYWYENGNLLPVNGTSYQKNTDYNNSGVYNITVVVSDLGKLSSLTWILTVNNVNRAPTIISTPITLTPPGVLYIYDVDATDPDGGPVKYYLTQKPIGMVIDENSGLINWTPMVGGNYQVTVFVNDTFGDNDSQQYSLSVNYPPNVSITLPNTGDKFHTNDQISFAGVANDVEDGPLTGNSVQWYSDIDGNIGSGTSFGTTLNPGLHTITISATDSANATSNDTVAIIVKGSCYDSDGINFYTQGFVKNTTDVITDQCYELQNVSYVPVASCNDCFVREYHCIDNRVVYSMYNCDCLNGSCFNANDTLTINSFTPSNPAVIMDEGQQVNFEVQASSTAGAISYRWFVDALMVGNSNTYSYLPSWDDAGLHTLLSIISDPNTRKEVEWTVTVNDVTTGSGPDLVIEYLQQLNTAIAGQITSFKFDMVNIGATTANDVYWSLDTGESVLNATASLNLPPGHTQTVYTFTTYNTTGAKTVTAMADSTGAVTESNETNNDQQIIVNVT